MDFLRKLPVPRDIKELMPLSAELAAKKEQRDNEIKDIFAGKNNRRLIIVGPCSADREDALLDYVERLASVQEKVKDKLVIIPRVYTSKPRTNGDGYKGMLHQPDPDKDSDMLNGVKAVRSLQLHAIEASGLFGADEMLYPDSYRYVSDLLSYVAVGARSVENQEHRLVSSGLDIPVGMKNPTGGDITVMMNSINAAQHSHMFIYRGWEVVSHGNPFAHAILRGYVDSNGHMFPNYHYENLLGLYNEYASRKLVNPAVIVDCNHANSAKNSDEQIHIAKEVLYSCRYSDNVNGLVKGFMIESYLEDGCQKVGGGVYGQSITDACLGWDKTERLIYDIADKI